MNLPLLAQALAGAGCPPDKCTEMAAQLDRRARQLAERKGRSHEEALRHLLGLMAQGWAAKRPQADALRVAPTGDGGSPSEPRP